MMRVDAHCHLWNRARGDYDWLDPADADLAPLMRDFTPSDLLAEMATAQIDRAIVVQAAPTLAETEFLLSLCDQTPQIAGIVGWVDTTQAASVATLERLALNPAFKGIRPMLQDEDDAHWLLTQPDQRVIDALCCLGLRFDGLVRPEQLSALLSFAKKNPTLPIVINHASKPVLSDMNDPSWANWRRDLQAFANETNAFCKLSGLLTEMDQHARVAPHDDLGLLFDQLISWFGPDRLMWGSDWPVLTLAASYSDWSQSTQTMLDMLLPADQAAINGTTAERFYGI